jgi:ribosomal-protein-alanine N-acetyltransferase
MLLSLKPSDAALCAALHARCFPAAEAWSAQSFAELIPSCFGFHHAKGLILCRAVADEAELLTLCVAPEAQGAGQGTELLRAALAEAKQRGLTHMHLEVAEDNTPARKLYEKLGFTVVGHRPNYYAGGRSAVLYSLILSIP